ncbi:hypothetical protein [Actinomadura sp. NPDC049753]|uniref:hypothetical protein n=1 Tax=Actinomadura sp. NPDC049753 TaxID=3154739 RepID=UPI00341E1234
MEGGRHASDGDESINRYFGATEQLFTEAVGLAVSPRTVIAGTGPDLAGETARTLATRTAPEAEELGPFLLMLRSAPSPRAAQIMREAIERHPRRHLREELSGTTPMRSERRAVP